MSRFGGTASKAALSVSESMHANVLDVRKGTWPELTTAKVMVTGTGRIIEGVIWGAGIPEGSDVSSYKGMSVVITKAGGRWIVLN